MLWEPYSIAADLVRPKTPCFDAQYAEPPPTPLIPAIEATLTILPAPCFSIYLISFCIQQNTPVKFILIVLFQSFRLSL